MGGLAVVERPSPSLKEIFSRKSTFLNILLLSWPGSLPPIGQVKKTVSSSLREGETPLPSRAAAAIKARFIKGASAAPAGDELASTRHET
jgi:hypothetical protein